MNKGHITTIFVILGMVIIALLSTCLIKCNTTENINETNIDGINITNTDYNIIYNRGYEHAFRDIMNATIVCKPLAITIDNTTVTLISIDCLSTK